MCGIFAMLFADKQCCEEFHKNHVEELLKNRGPDESSVLFDRNIFYAATVLWHQGDNLISQPIRIENDKILLFNGDLFMDITGSDTLHLETVLKDAQCDADLITIFKSLTGPFSMIFYANNSLYFIRDSLGRNSLIIGSQNEAIFLSSVIDSKVVCQVMEVPPLGLYKINLDSKKVDLFPFQEISHEHHLQQLDDVRKIINVELRDENIQPQWLMLQQPVINFSFDQLNLEEIEPENIFECLLENPIVSDLCDRFLQLLAKSVHDRVTKTQPHCKNCLNHQNKCQHCNVAVLFSGGVDCSLLTALAHKFIDIDRPIDLLNVAFEKVSNKSDKIDFNVPDRLTGLETFEELKKLFPDRKFNFVEINIKRSQLYEMRSKLSSLVYPLLNVLDESLGIAIYFASRGRGIVNEAEYESPSRVILMGSGADELFGGYSRHRNAFRRSTSENDLLTKELELDWIRLPSRNLARDDRVIGDNGITGRSPFVEENFVNFARNLKPLQRCFPKLPEGIGDKLLLRLCAHKLGLTGCSRFKKRALQFGSRIADKKQSATDRSKLLKN